MQNFDQIKDIQVTLTVELGKAKMSIRDLLKLMPGSIINLDTEVGIPLKFYINGKYMGLCEIVTINDKYGMRIIEIEKKK